MGIAVELRDERQQGQPPGTRFPGELTPDQAAAAAALLPHETGILAAPTAFGKTVIAAKMIAERNRNTLVLVHRRQLLDQWVARLQAFLDIPPNKIGVIHGGKKKATGNIDVALMQSLVRKGVVSDRIADYGKTNARRWSSRSAGIISICWRIVCRSSRRTSSFYAVA